MDAGTPAAPAEGAEGDDADTEESSSDSELPDTTAPAVAKAEERAGAAVAAPTERSAADVDMGEEMTEAAAANPGLTVGELVDKTTDKLTFMKGYMEGCVRMVNAEAALSSRAGAEHREVLAQAARVLHEAEEYLEQRDAEAGAAASGAPFFGSAALGQDARVLEGIDAFMGTDPAPTGMIPSRGPLRKRSPRGRSSCPMTRGELTVPPARFPVSLRRPRTSRTRALSAGRGWTPWYAGTFTGWRATGSSSRRRFFRSLRAPTSSVRISEDFFLVSRGKVTSSR